MICLCEEQEIFDLKLEGDFGADPIWCNSCGCNIDLEEMLLSDELKNELLNWVIDFGKWIDIVHEKWLPNGSNLENAHNTRGLCLVEKIQDELGKAYTITFISSNMSKS